MSEASAPASSANLGPGFDSIALALELRCCVSASPAEEWSIDHGEGQKPEADSDDAVLAAAQAAVGTDRPLALKVDNAIPIGRGLGSSAAALASGAAAALISVGHAPDPDRVFEMVAEIEGHPDNAAAAVYGGLALVTPTGPPRRLPIHPGIRPVLAVPGGVFFTAEARQAVPERVERGVAVRTAARMAALVAGFITGDPDIFLAARGDEIHEVARSLHRPETAELVQRAGDAGALHAAWSGSGPSVIALVDSGSERRVALALEQRGAEIFVLDVASRGLVVSA